MAHGEASSAVMTWHESVGQTRILSLYRCVRADPRLPASVVIASAMGGASVTCGSAVATRWERCDATSVTCVGRVGRVVADAASCGVTVMWAMSHHVGALQTNSTSCSDVLSAII